MCMFAGIASSMLTPQQAELYELLVGRIKSEGVQRDVEEQCVDGIMLVYLTLVPSLAPGYTQHLIEAVRFSAADNFMAFCHLERWIVQSAKDREEAGMPFDAFWLGNRPDVDILRIECGEALLEGFLFSKPKTPISTVRPVAVSEG